MAFLKKKEPLTEGQRFFLTFLIGFAGSMLAGTIISHARGKPAGESVSTLSYLRSDQPYYRIDQMNSGR